MLDQAIQQVRAQLGGTGSAAMTGGAPAAPASGGGAVQTGPAQVAPQAPPSGPGQPGTNTPSSQPTTKPVGSEPDLGTKWDDPRLKNLAHAYDQDLQAAARTPALTGHPDFQQKIVKDGRAVGRTNSEIAADVRAYQLKAGTGPHPEHMPEDQQQIRTQRQQALQQGTQAGTPSQSGTPVEPASSASQTPQPQVSAVPPGTPGAGAAGPTSYEGPHALPAAMQGLMAAAGVTPTGMQAYGTTPMGAAEAQAISQAQAKDRPQLFANFGIDPTTVPADIMNAAPAMTEAQRGIEWNRVYGEAMGLVKQGQDPTGIVQGAAAAGVITPDMAAAFLQEPSVMQPMIAAAQTNAETLRNNNLLKGVRYQDYIQAIATAKTTQDLNRARIKYLGSQQQSYGSLAQAHVAEAWASVNRNNAEAGAIKDGSWFQQNTAQNRSLTDQIRDAQTLLSNSQTNYDTILNYGRSLLSNFQDPTSAQMPDGTPYAQALQNAKDNRDAAQQALRSLTQGAAGRTVDSTVNPGAGGPKVKGGAPPFQAPPGWKAEKINGHWAIRNIANPNQVQYWQNQ